MPTISRDVVECVLAALLHDEVFLRLHAAELRSEFGDNANGDPAIWVYVIMSDDVPPELLRGAHFEERQRVREALEAVGWDGPVYTHFRLVSEELALRQHAAMK